MVCGDTAFYIDPGRPESIVAALDTLRTDRQAWHNRCTIGIKRAAQLFHGWDAIGLKVITLLERVARGEGTLGLFDEESVKEWVANQLPFEGLSRKIRCKTV